MDGYEKIEKELKLDKLRYADDILVTIKMNGGIFTTRMEFDTVDYNGWIWEHDWWEGEEDVEFVGAQLLCDVVIEGNKLEYRKEA